MNNKLIRIDNSLDKIINEVVSYHLRQDGRRIPIHIITRKIADILIEKQLKKELIEDEFIKF